MKPILTRFFLLSVLLSAAVGYRVDAGNLHRSASVNWTPTNLGTSLVAWWDANSGVVLSGSNVTSWTDRKGGIVASGGVSPTFSATARNGVAGLTFSGSQYLTFAATSLPHTSTARSVSVASYATAIGVFSFAYGLNTSTEFLAILCGSPSNTTQGYDGTTAVSTTENCETVDKFAVFGLNGSGSGTWNVDGNPDETFSFSTNTTGNFGFIGSYISAGTAAWAGVIQQIVVTNTLPSANAKACLAGWESWYDGKAGSNLPGGSPYKSRPPHTTDNCS